MTWEYSEDNLNEQAAINTFDNSAYNNVSRNIRYDSNVCLLSDLREDVERKL